MRSRLDPDASRALWRAARTFEDLCELGARFVEGQLSFFPGWSAPGLDPESDEIGVRLARLCRLGFLTLASQPARAEQRAFVSAFAAPDAALRLAGRESSGGLVIAVYASAVQAQVREPVSLHQGVAHAFAGHDARAEELECFEDCVSPSALEALRHASYVSAFDTVWGRADVLWGELERRLERT